MGGYVDGTMHPSIFIEICKVNILILIITNFFDNDITNDIIIVIINITIINGSTSVIRSANNYNIYDIIY